MEKLLLTRYECLCGCGKWWRALKRPQPEHQYAIRTHRPQNDYNSAEYNKLDSAFYMFRREPKA